MNQKIQQQVFWKVSQFPANKFIEFNVKLFNSSPINFNSWNCTEVKAKGINNSIFPIVF